MVNDQEFFLDFKNYPWFQDATIKELSNLKLIHGSHLYWKDLDIDLELDSLENLEKYPLVYR
jgi:hypothetical protein